MLTNIRWARDATDLLHRVEIGAKATIHCEDPSINDRCNRQVEEAVY